MPFIKLAMPENVDSRARADGSHRYYFLVRRNRPEDWPKTIPFDSKDGAGLISELDEPARFAAALEAWARGWNERLASAREGTRGTGPAPNTLPWVFERYKDDDRFKSKKPVTRKNYEKLSRYVNEWARLANYPHVKAYTYAGVEAFLNGWQDAPFQRKALQRFLSLMFEHAKRLRLRTDNPAADMALSVPDSTITIWEDAVTAFVVAVADKIGRPSIGDAIMLAREIGPRQTDVVLMRAPDQYDGASFIFDTSKTGKKLDIRATAILRARLNRGGIPLHRHLIVSETTGEPYKLDNFRHVFAEVRACAAAIQAGGGMAKALPPIGDLKFRHLRHTAVLMLARAGCTEAEIAAITGHSLQTVSQILKHYLPRDSVVAGNAISKLESYRSR